MSEIKCEVCRRAIVPVDGKVKCESCQADLQAFGGLMAEAQRIYDMVDDDREASVARVDGAFRLMVGHGTYQHTALATVHNAHSLEETQALSMIRTAVRVAKGYAAE